MSEASPTRVLQIVLPDAMMQFIAEQLAEQDYDSPSEYIRELVRADQKRHAKSRLESVLLSAIASGDPSDVTSEMFEEVGRTLPRPRRE